MNRAMTAIARIISLIAALTITVTVLVFPRSIALDMYSVPHGWLVLLMFGMSFGFVHGVGFIPQNKYLKTVFSPIIAWPLMTLGAWMVFV